MFRINGVVLPGIFLTMFACSRCVSKMETDQTG